MWFCVVILSPLYKNARNWKSNSFTYFIVTSKLLRLQRLTIPHFKALDKLFWPLAWVLTLGAITFVLLRKVSVYFFSWHTLYTNHGLKANAKKVGHQLKNYSLLSWLWMLDKIIVPHRSKSCLRSFFRGSIFSSNPVQDTALYVLVLAM